VEHAGAAAVHNAAVRSMCGDLRHKVHQSLAALHAMTHTHVMVVNLVIRFHSSSPTLPQSGSGTDDLAYDCVTVVVPQNIRMRTHWSTA